MNLLEQMSAEAFKKVLDFKEQYPSSGAELVKALTEKKFAIQLTISEAIDLSNALGINYAGFLGQIYDAFTLQFTNETLTVTQP
jgi:hypothetical protein